MPSAAEKSLKDLSLKLGLGVDELIEQNPMLSTLSNREQKPQSKSGEVWTADDMAPSSHIYSHKQTIRFEWSPVCMTRLLDHGELPSLEV